MNFWLLALLSRNNLAISKLFLSRAILSIVTSQFSSFC